MSLYDDARAAWHAVPNTWTAAQRAYYTIPPAQRLGVSWHYPGDGVLGITPDSSHTECLARVLAWQHEHMTDPAKLWADIGYNGLICQHARVIEGRGFDLKGAHSPGVNWTHYGIQFMVSDSEAPTSAMYARAVQLRADLEARSGHTLRQWGHKDDPAASTDCPGPIIEAWVHSGGPYAAPTEEDPLSGYTPADLEGYAATGVLGAQVGHIVEADGKPTTVGMILDRIYRAAAAESAQLTAMTAAVQALSGASPAGVSADQVLATVQAAVTEALSRLVITGSVPAAPAPAPGPATP